MKTGLNEFQDMPLPAWQRACTIACILTIFIWTSASPAGLSSQTHPRTQASAVIHPESLLPANGGDGSFGFVVNGSSSNARFGISVSLAGDFTNNGHRELLAGAYLWEDFQGAVVLIEGNVDVPMTSHGLEMQDLIDGGINPAPGWVGLHSNANATLGRRVRNLGDLNGDGFDDIGVASRRPISSAGISHGELFVVYGGIHLAKVFTNIVDLHPDNGGDGSNGLVITGAESGILLAKDFDGSHDISGDGLDDLLLLTNNTAGEERGLGVTFVMYGGSQLLLPPLITYDDLYGMSTAMGFRILPPNRGDALPTPDFGFQNARLVNDVNGDGIGEIVMCRRVFWSNDRQLQGECYLIFGREESDPFPPVLDLGELLLENGGDGSAGVVMYGSESQECLGSSPFVSATIDSDQVSSLGDLNRNGYNDLLIGAPGCGIPGKAYVIHGQEEWPAEVHLGSPTQGGAPYPEIMRIEPPLPVAANRGFAQAVAGIGDFNGNGYPDIALHNTAGQPLEQNGAFVIYGGPDMPEVFHTADLLPENGGDGSRGFLIRNFPGEEMLGTALSSGDFNGDGAPDLALGGFASDPNGLSNAGRVVVLYGTPPPTPLQVPVFGPWGWILLLAGLLLSGMAIARGRSQGTAHMS